MLYRPFSLFLFYNKPLDMLQLVQHERGGEGQR